MARFAAVVALVTALGAGCSSNSSTGICCIQINQTQAAWSCPSQASYQACCGGTDSSTDGCISDPTGSPQNSCMSVYYATNCNG